MPRGGARAGAGRKKGSKSKRVKLQAKGLFEGRETPLAYMVRVLNDPKAKEQRRDDMAKAAAPYVHPRLSAVDHSGTLNTRQTHELSPELEQLIRDAVAAGSGS